MKTYKQKMKRGFMLIEMLFYISLFSIVSFAVISSLITMNKSFRQTTASADLVQSASIMEKISREIRQAYDIYSITEPSLKLNTKDESNINKTVQFTLSNNDLHFFENDVLIGNLNTPNIRVSNLAFRRIITAKGQAVRVSFSVTSTRDRAARVEWFYDTVVLRGEYGN